MLSRFPIFDSENDENDELTRLMTSDASPENIKSALLTAETHGIEKIREFVDTRLCRQKGGFHDTLKQSQSPSKKSQTIKADINLFQWLLVAKDSRRDVDLKNIMSHELTTVPLALADTTGNLRQTNKAALGKILEQGVTAEVLPVSALKTRSIIDGQALVQAIRKPSRAKPSGDLADAFNEAVFNHFNQNCPRVDVVFDRYRKASIKSGTRSKRERRMRSIHRTIDSRDIPHTFSAIN